MKQQESEVSGQGSGVEREPAVKGRDSGYLTRISVFLITLSGLILEVGLTRIYSASIWYHFAFVAISVALLGWGLGGFTVHLLKQRMRLSMETAALVTLLYADAIPPAAFSSLRFAHRSLLQEFRNPQFAIRNSYTCLLALSPLR